MQIHENIYILGDFFHEIFIFDCQCNTCLFLDFLALELGRKAVFLCFFSGNPNSSKILTKQVLIDLNRLND